MNERFVPPYESGASLYIRPILFGTGAQVGVKPANEYMFIVFVTPVGPYFKGGFQTTPFVIMRQYDRSAPLGMGKYKVGGNYAASLVAGEHAHELGYSISFIWMPKRKNTSTNVVLPISSESKTIHTSHCIKFNSAFHYQQKSDGTGSGNGADS